MEFAIKEGFDIPTTGRQGKGVNYVNTFKELRPTLDKMDKKGQGVFVPNNKPVKAKRDLGWIINKYGAQMGKRFAIISNEKDANHEEAGVTIILADANATKSNVELSDRQKEIVGNALDMPETKAEPAPETKA